MGWMGRRGVGVRVEAGGWLGVVVLAVLAAVVAMVEIVEMAAMAAVEGVLADLRNALQREYQLDVLLILA